MNILSQNYNNLLKNMIFNIFTTNLKQKLDTLDNTTNVFNYVELLSNLDESLCFIARESLVTLFESLDKEYSNSLDRKRKYDIKSHHSRTILTIFGEITFTRTFYQSKLDHKLYCFIDRYLGLHKYDYFDPYIKSLVVHYAAYNSYPETAKYINDLIGNRVSIHAKTKYLSRQSIRNILLSSITSEASNNFKENTPEALHIIADEKWIHTQNNDNKDVMEKSIVLFENIKDHKLHNKQIFASLDSSFLDNCLDYIYNTYDIDKLKYIYVMGDGAKWIKSLRTHFNFTSNIHVVCGLDKFHFKQAVHHLCLDNDLENIITGYVLHKKKKSFIECCDCLINSYPHRKDTIEAKREYILNNWANINNLYKYNLSCPMESQISHNIAAFFTSRPKGYSIKMINKLTKLRLLYKNHHNIKELYLNNFNSNTTLSMNKKQLNIDIFDKYKHFIPYYQDKIYNPSI